MPRYAATRMSDQTAHRKMVQTLFVGLGMSQDSEARNILTGTAKSN
jgi:hypothetical protein